MKGKIKQLLAVVVGLGLIAVPVTAFASTATLSQTINNGTLSTNIYQTDDSTPIASPAVAFPAKNVALSCQTSAATLGDGANTGTGVLNVTNTDTTNTGGYAGWTLSLGATAGSTATWTDTKTPTPDTYSFNAASCSAGGLMTVDPSVATITPDCGGIGTTCTNDGTSLGSASQAFTSSNSVTLMSDSNYSPWQGYIEGVGLSQQIPASQPAGSYSLGMTITVAGV